MSGFGELWEVDERTQSLRDVSHYRALVRCDDVSLVPSALSLWVEDRRYCIRVVIDSLEGAQPILLGEAEDQRLGLTSWEDQQRFAPNFSSSNRPARPYSAGVRSHDHGLGHPSPRDAPPPSLLQADVEEISKGLPPSGILMPVEVCVALDAESFPPLAASSSASGHFDQPGTSARGPTEDVPSQVLLASNDLKVRGKTMPHHRSSRLAAKHKGRMKSTLYRAQDLLCRKHKFVRIAARASRSTSSASRAPPLPASPGEPPTADVPPVILPGAPSSPPAKDGDFVEVSSVRRDHQLPL